jgi:hypothetical protein
VLRRVAVGLGVVAVVLLAVAVYLGTRLRNEREIVRAQVELEYMREQRDSILSIVARNDSLQTELNIVRASLEGEANRLRARVDELEAGRAAAQLTVRGLRRRADLEDRLRSTFPEMAASDWGVTEVFNEAEQVGVEYLLVPLWFSETFVIDHQNAVAWRAQADTLRALDTLRVRISTLQDSVFTLERSSRDSYQVGYQDAFGRYESLNADYIDLLRQPRFSLGVKGGVATMAGTFGLGLLVGAVAK